MGQETPKSVVYVTEKLTDKPNQTGSFRAGWDSAILARSYSAGINNLQHLWQQSLRKFSSRPLFGKIVEKEQQSLMCKSNISLGVQYVTYSDVHTKVVQVGSGIKNLMLAPENKNHISPIFLFAGNCQQWMWVDLAAALYGLTVVTIYQSLGIESIPYILNQTQGVTIFCKSKQCQTLGKLKDLGKLLNVVLLDNSTVKPIEKLKIMRLQEVLQAGKKIVAQPQIPPQQIFTICYTSGTTGMPKGAMLTHANLLALVTSVHSVKGIFGEEPDTFISYLPLPHIFERGIMYNTISMGFRTTFFRGSADKLLEDIQIVQPSIFVGVPRVFNKFYTKIMQGLNSVTGISKSIADSAVQSKLQRINQDGSHKSFLYDSLVFNKIKKTFGGNIRLCITGSAPIEKSVLKFLKMALVCDFIEVYGSTESCGCFFATDIADADLGHVGGPTVTCEYKLKDVPDMNYTSMHQQSGQRAPQGQVLIRGPGVFQGYYNQPQKTKEALDPQGWLQTGDIGMILPHNKALKIIDRKKNLFKLSQGQYISPQKIQNIYMSQGGMNEAFVHGDPLQSFTILIVYADDITLKYFCNKNGITGEPSELRNRKQFRVKYLEVLNENSKKTGSVNSLELCKNVKIMDKSFVERGCLTVTMKIKRHQARKAYEKQLEQLYKQGSII